MTEHYCKHEKELGEIGQWLVDIASDVRDIKNKLNNGLSVQTALNKQSISRLWWFVGFIFSGVVGLAFCVIQKVI